MKTPVRLALITVVLLSAIGMYSCNKKPLNENNIKGMAEFSFSFQAQKNLDRSAAVNDSGMVSYQLMISVEDMNGAPVLTDKLIPVYAFGTGFVSEKIEIRAGEYNLTKFIVIAPSGEVVFASPMEGSSLAYLTNDPLPIHFIINPDLVTSIIPEVLVVGDHSPGEFGYVNFGVQIITPLEFWAICYLDNPLIMAPTQLTSAKLTITSKDGWQYTFKLEPALNHLIIRGGSEIYTFLLEKEGYISQTMQITAGELKDATKENPLVLKIPWGPQLQVLEFQPGPEKGKDAMISNLDPDKNFGSYKYFETTFLSEPVLTVMRSNRSLIYFNTDLLPAGAQVKKVTLRLMYDLPIPWDSLSIMNTDPTTGVIAYGAVFQQIIEPWEENGVTWNNQPKTTEANQVFLYPFIKNSNIVDVDVTTLFVNPSASVLPNYGMLFRLWPNDMFPGFRFASSDYTDASMRPKLIIYYTI